MARRSYLGRVAEPLPPGQPVLFAVPRPAPDAVRPAATPKARTASAPAAKPATAAAPKPTAVSPSAPAAAAAPLLHLDARSDAAPAAIGDGPLTATPPPTQVTQLSTGSIHTSSSPEPASAAELPIVSVHDRLPAQFPTSAAPLANISWAAKPVGHAPPRIHIGTIEVRTSPPPAPVPAGPPSPQQQSASTSPSGDTVAYSRAYGWRFGLSQS